MSDHVQIHSIVAFVVGKMDYQRMVDNECSGIVLDQTYAQFLDWNTKCISELSTDDRAWVWGLCQQISKRNIKLMDMEPCSVFTAFGIYYTTNKTLCIVNPR
jgi:hypothetical protein